MKKKLTEGKNTTELKQMLVEKREELRALRFAAAGARGTDTNAGKTIRKDVARILTALTAQTA